MHTRHRRRREEHATKSPCSIRFGASAHPSGPGDTRGGGKIHSKVHLNLEAARLATTTGALEFAALGGDVGLLVFVGTHAEVLVCLARGTLTAKEDGVGTSRCAQSELVKGQSLATSLDDALAG